MNNPNQATVSQSFDIVETKLIKDYLKARKIKPLTKKQLSSIFELMDHREQRAQMIGFNHGKASVIIPPHPPLKTEVAMTIQRLGDANAQIGNALARILEKL